MRTTAAISSLCLSTTLGDAFILPPPTRALPSSLQHRPTRASSAMPVADPGVTASKGLPALPVMKLSGEDGYGMKRADNPTGRVRRARRRRAGCLSLASSFDPAGGDSSPRSSTPTGPGAGVIDLQFESLKAGGFKVFLLFFLLGQGRAKDNDTPFSVRDTAEGIRVLIGDETKNDSQWDGVLDLTWGVEPKPFFRVDRIDVNEVIPYPGELYILNKLLDSIIDVNGEQSVEDHQKLFMFREGEQNQLAEAKATLAGMAALG